MLIAKSSKRGLDKIMILDIENYVEKEDIEKILKVVYEGICGSNIGTNALARVLSW